MQLQNVFLMVLAVMVGSSMSFPSNMQSYKLRKLAARQTSSSNDDGSSTACTSALNGAQSCIDSSSDYPSLLSCYCDSTILTLLSNCLESGSADSTSLLLASACTLYSNDQTDAAASCLQSEDPESSSCSAASSVGNSSNGSSTSSGSSGSHGSGNSKSGATDLRSFVQLTYATALTVASAAYWMSTML